MKQFESKKITELAKKLFKEERRINRLDGWFLIQELQMNEGKIEGNREIAKADLLVKIAENLPISVSDNAIFVGTQRDGFARSYALINPTFKVEEFNGYCDPTAVFGDIEPNG